MDDEKWQELNELFGAALGMPAAERIGLVEKVRDPKMRTELESLLTSHEASEKFLDKNAVEITAKTLAEGEPESMAGRQIGQFRIICEIGRGGMGAVYLAERVDGEFTQQAALKLIKRGMDTDFIIQRFQNERQILSRLNHPYIAKLLDGGTTADGLPFFLMEYVEGRNLSEFVAEEHPSLDRKIVIFREICDAVAFAHRNLVVHRDLKPSNIIITGGKPKLLDFGIAKLLDSDSEDRTTTEFRLLTPKYASPEQARGEPVSTLSDVYSLGVVLEELAGEDTTRIGPELKTIIGKAKSDDPARRYASVEQLSEDLRRYENKLPILARPDSFYYRARKFTERHRFGVTAAVLLLVTLIAGITATFWQWRRARAESELAQRRFEDVRSLANSVVFDLHDEIQNLPGSTKARKLLIEKALEYLNKLELDAGSDVGLQHELAMAYLKIADVQGQVFEASLLETDEAVVNYRKALDLSEKTVAAEPGNVDYRADLAWICYRFAESLRGANDLTEAIVLEKRSAELFESAADARPDDMVLRRRLFVARSGVADVLKESGGLAESLPIYEKNVTDSETAVSKVPADVKLNRFLAIAYGGYSGALLVNGDLERALETLGRSQAVTQRISTENPDDMDLYRNVGVVAEGMERIASALGKYELAERNALEDVKVMEKIAADDDENMEAKYDVASAHNNYGDLLEKMGRWPETLEHRRKVLVAIVPLEKKENNPDLYTADFFEFYCKFARTSARLGHADEAKKYIQKAVDLSFDIERGSVETRNLYAQDFTRVGDAWHDMGDETNAREWYAKALSALRSLESSGKLYPLVKPGIAELEAKIKG